MSTHSKKLSKQILCTLLAAGTIGLVGFTGTVQAADTTPTSDFLRFQALEAGSNNTVAVAEGQTTSLDTTTSDAKTITKTGTGTLAITNEKNNFYGNFTSEGGTVTLTSNSYDTPVSISGTYDIKAGAVTVSSVGNVTVGTVSDQLAANGVALANVTYGENGTFTLKDVPDEATGTTADITGIANTAGKLNIAEGASFTVDNDDLVVQNGGSVDSKGSLGMWNLYATNATVNSAGTTSLGGAYLEADNSTVTIANATKFDPREIHLTNNSAVTVHKDSDFTLGRLTATTDAGSTLTFGTSAEAVDNITASSIKFTDSGTVNMGDLNISSSTFNVTGGTLNVGNGKGLTGSSFTLNSTGTVNVNGDVSLSAGGIDATGKTHITGNLTGSAVTMNIADAIIDGGNVTAKKNGKITLGGDELQLNHVNIASTGYIVLTGGKLNATDLATAITGDGQVTIDGNGIISSTYGQMFADGAFTADAAAKLKLVSGAISLNDKTYTLSDLQAIKGALTTDTEVVPTGTLVDAEGTEVKTITLADAASVGNKIALEQFAVEGAGTDGTLTLDSGINVGALKLADGTNTVAIAGQNITLGGSQIGEVLQAAEGVTPVLTLTDSATLQLGNNALAKTTAINANADINATDSLIRSNGAAAIGGNVSLTDADLAVHTGSLTLKKALTVAGAADLSGTITVAGATQAAGEDAANINIGTSSATGDVTLHDVNLNGGSLAVQSGSTLTLSGTDAQPGAVQAAISVNKGTLASDGPAAVTGGVALTNGTIQSQAGSLGIDAITASGTNTLTGDVKVSDGISSSASSILNIGTSDTAAKVTTGNIDVNTGTVTVDGASTLTLSGETGQVTANKLNVNNGSTLASNGNATINAAILLNGDKNTIDGQSGSLVATQDVKTYGDADILGNVTMNGNFTTTFASNVNTNGNVVIDGNLLAGYASVINLADKITVKGDVQGANAYNDAWTVNVTGTADFQNNVNLNGAALEAVTGKASIGKDLNVTDTSYVTGNVDIKGNIALADSSDLLNIGYDDVGADISAGGIAMNGGSINLASGRTLTLADNAAINGAGTIQADGTLKGASLTVTGTTINAPGSLVLTGALAADAANITAKNAKIDGTVSATNGANLTLGGDNLALNTVTIDEGSNVTLQSGVLNATDLTAALPGAGKLTLSGTGVLSTMAGQVFTNAATTEETAAESNGLTTDATSRVDFAGGNIALNDAQYTLAYVDDVKGVMTTAAPQTGIIMKGQLVNADGTAKTSVTLDEAQQAGSSVALDQLTVDASANADGEVTIDSGVNVGALKVDENTTTVAITEGQDVTLGGTSTSDVISSTGDTTPEVKLGDGSSLTIGNAAVGETQDLNVSADLTATTATSTINTNGNTTVDGNVSLAGSTLAAQTGTLTVNKDLTAATGSTITGDVTVAGAIKAADTDAATTINIGGTDTATNVKVSNVNLNADSTLAVQQGSTLTLQSTSAVQPASVTSQVAATNATIASNGPAEINGTVSLTDAALQSQAGVLSVDSIATSGTSTVSGNVNAGAITAASDNAANLNLAGAALSASSVDLNGGEVALTSGSALSLNDAGDVNAAINATNGSTVATTGTTAIKENVTLADSNIQAQNGTMTLEKGLAASGSSALSGNVIVNGAVTTEAGSTLTANGNVTLQDVTTAAGTTLQTAGTTNITGTVTLTDSAIQATSGTTTVNTLTTSGTSSLSGNVTVKGDVTTESGSTLKTAGTANFQQDVALTGSTLAVESGTSTIANDLKTTGTSTVTGDVAVAGNITGDADTILNIGRDDAAGTISAQSVDLGGGTLFLDPVWHPGNTIVDASKASFASAEDGTFVVGQNFVLTLGSTDTAIAEKAFADSGMTWGDSGVLSALYVNASQNLANKAIVVDGSLTQDSAFTAPENGTLTMAANTVLMVNGNAFSGNQAAALTNVKALNIDEGSTLYIDNAVKDTTYNIVSPAENTTLGSGWSDIRVHNQLLKANQIAGDGVTVKTTNQDASDVYGNNIVDPAIVNAAIAGNDAANDFFNNAANDLINPTKAQQAKAINSAAALTELGGVQHSLYAANNLFNSAVVNHLADRHQTSQDKDIWAHYLHSKESVDGLNIAGLGSANYDVQYNGVIVGADLYQKHHTTAGLAFTYLDGDISGSSGAAYTKNDAEYYGLSLYGKHQRGNTSYLGDISWLHGKNDLTQYNSTQKITGSVDSNAFSIGLRAEQNYKAGIGTLTPYVGLRYAHLDFGSYTDNLGIHHNADNANLWLVPVGLRYSQISQHGSWTLKPSVELGYLWTAGDRNGLDRLNLNGSMNTFGYDLADTGSFYGRVGLEAQKGSLTYNLGYQYQKGSSSHSNALMAGVSYKF